MYNSVTLAWGGGGRGDILQISNQSLILGDLNLYVLIDVNYSELCFSFDVYINHSDGSIAVASFTCIMIL